MARDHDGTIRYGSGTGPFTTAVKPVVSVTQMWDPPPLAAGRAAKLFVRVDGATPGDVCTVSHDAIGANMVQLSAHISAAGEVMVVMRACAAEDVGSEAVDVEPGLLRIVVSKYG
jgi:hypothetical protein